MNPFRQCISDLGLTFESQGTGLEDSWIFVLLNVMGDNEETNPVSPTFAQNPVKETLHRLQAYLGTFAGQRLAQVLDRVQFRYSA